MCASWREVRAWWLTPRYEELERAAAPLLLRARLPSTDCCCRATCCCAGSGAKWASCSCSASQSAAAAHSQSESSNASITSKPLRSDSGSRASTERSAKCGSRAGGAREMRASIDMGGSCRLYAGSTDAEPPCSSWIAPGVLRPAGRARAECALEEHKLVESPRSKFTSSNAWWQQNVKRAIQQTSGTSKAEQGKQGRASS